MEDNLFEKFDRIFKDESFREALKKDLENRINNSDQNNYKVNRPQWGKMMSILEYLIERFPGYDKEVEYPVIVPAEENGDIEFKFSVLYLNNIVEIIDFTQMLENGNKVVFDSSTSGQVCIAIMVSKVFIPKDEEEREVV